MENEQRDSMHKLTIIATSHGRKMLLDNFELEAVSGFELKSITPKFSELTVKLTVSNAEIFPDDSGNNLSGDV